MYCIHTYSIHVNIYTIDLWKIASDALNKVGLKRKMTYEEIRSAWDVQVNDLID